MTRMRLVLVGCGRQATSILHTSAQFNEKIEVVACCDLNAERAAFTAKRFSLSEYYTDLAKMLSKAKADAALVVSFPAVQGDLTLQCLNAGLHVMTEKPISTELAVAEHIQETANKQGKICRVSFNKRFAPAYVRMKEAIESQGFGKVSAIYSKFAGGYRPKTLDMLRVGAIHMFDLTRFLAGDYEELFAYKNEKAEGQASFTVNYRMKNGAVGIFLLSSLGVWSSKGSEYIEVRGDQNIFSVDSGRQTLWQKPPLSMETGATTQSVIEVPSPAEYFEPNYSDVGYLEMQSYYLGGFYGSLDSFANDVIFQNFASSPNSTDGIAALNVALAIQKSFETGKPVSL